MPESSVFHSESILYDAVWIQYEIYHLKDICGSGIYPTWILCAIVKYSKCSKCQKFKPHKQVIRESRSTVSDWYLTGTRLIPRLNFENFGIFELSVWNLNLNSSNCRASKIISNDAKLAPMSWQLSIENLLSYFCVGVWVDRHPPIPEAIQPTHTIGTNQTLIIFDSEENYFYDIETCLFIMC